MLSPVRRQIAGHEVLELETAKPYAPYDRLVLRETKGRTIWTVLLCEPADCGWAVTATRCPEAVAGGARRGVPGGFDDGSNPLPIRPL